MIGISKRKKYAMFFLCVLVLIFGYLKTDGLYNKYVEDIENKIYDVVVVQNLGEDENKVRYLVKLKYDSFILNIYKENKFYKNENKYNFSGYVYGDELEVRGKIIKSEVYGNMRRIRLRKIFGI